jgi:hypothetical protein
MDAVDSTLLGKLDLRTAAEQEASTWRNLIPPEPWLPIVGKDPGKFAKAAKVHLESGRPSSIGVISNSRKAHQAFRPVPILGILERIQLRALTNWVLDGFEAPARSSEDYRRFVTGPILSARFSDKGILRLSHKNADYIIQSDIAAFYQYVDHSVLLGELELRSGKVRASRVLINLLTEIQGRSYGLPQLVDSSDRLSEVYIEIIERELIRKGLKVWRYNDDFRFTASGYDSAQQAVEILSSCAHDIGLILNEDKTKIFKFSTYFWKYFIGDSTADADVEVRPEDFKVVNEYGELDDKDLAKEAEATFRRVDQRTGGGAIDLRNTKPEDARDLRSAISILIRLSDSSQLPKVPDLFRFLPQLTPKLCNYLVKLHGEGVDIGLCWDEIIKYSGGYNSWQRAWLVYVARECTLLSVDERKNWVTRQQKNRTNYSSLLHAESSLALAAVDSISFGELDLALRTESSALSPWYVLAMKTLSKTTDSQLRAVKGSSTLYEALLGD